MIKMKILTGPQGSGKTHKLKHYIYSLFPINCPEPLSAENLTAQAIHDYKKKWDAVFIDEIDFTKFSTLHFLVLLDSAVKNVPVILAGQGPVPNYIKAGRAIEIIECKHPNFKTNS